MSFVGPLIRCMYSIYAYIVGSMTTLDWCCPYIFLANTEMYYAVGSTLVPRCFCALVLYKCVDCGGSYLFTM